MNSIELNGFELSIPNGVKKVDSGANYYSLPDRTEYHLKLYNNRRVRCDAEVWIDGERVGTWRINGYSSISIYRPTHVNRKFVFVDEGSKIARDTGNVRGKDTNGLIKVVFKPEIEHIVMYNHLSDGIRGSYERKAGFNQSFSLESNDYSAGLTVLGDRSTQHFDKTRAIESVDRHNITTIYARLIVDKKYEGYQDKYIHISSGRYETEIPKPIQPGWF